MIERFFNNRDLRLVAMGTSMAVSVLMLLGKIAAFVLTDSTAIFSDAAESVVHVFATGIAGVSLWYSTQPPDQTHPYGHGKIAYFSMAFEGGFILFAALSVFYTALRALMYGHQIHELGTGLGILGILTLVNLVLGWFLIRVGRTQNSLVLEANGKHVLTDMWTSLGVIVGIGLVWLTGVTWLDPVVALLVGSNIMWTAGKLLYRAYHGLMERADREDTERLVRDLEAAVDEDMIMGYHQLRHRRVNDQVFIEVHLLFPRNLSVDEAHRRAHEVEDRLEALFPKDETYITSHLEPENHEAAHPEGHQEPDDPLPSLQTNGRS